MECPLASIEPTARQNCKAIHVLTGSYNCIILIVGQNEMMARALFLSIKPLPEVRQLPQEHFHFGKALPCVPGPWEGRGPETTPSSPDRGKMSAGGLRKVPFWKPNGHLWPSFPRLPPAHCWPSDGGGWWGVSVETTVHL